MSQYRNHKKILYLLSNSSSSTTFLNTQPKVYSIFQLMGSKFQTGKTVSLSFPDSIDLKTSWVLVSWFREFWLDSWRQRNGDSRVRFQSEEKRKEDSFIYVCIFVGSTVSVGNGEKRVYRLQGFVDCRHTRLKTLSLEESCQENSKGKYSLIDSFVSDARDIFEFI